MVHNKYFWFKEILSPEPIIPSTLFFLDSHNVSRQWVLSQVVGMEVGINEYVGEDVGVLSFL